VRSKRRPEVVSLTAHFSLLTQHPRPPRLTGHPPPIDCSIYRQLIYQQTIYIERLPLGETMRRTERAGRAPESYLPLPPATFQILLALLDGERHGYAIMRELAERTAAAGRIGPGTLYGSLKRLLEAGLVEEGAERADPDLGDERRRYYRITEFGLSVARAEARRLEGMVRAARQKKLIGPEPA
jgi:DNA-binding PadR family transcriptional regulator